MSFAVEVSIITSQDLPIYEQAYEGFNHIYKGETIRYDLKGNLRESDKIIRKISDEPPDLIVAIGLLAATVAKENFSKGFTDDELNSPAHDSLWCMLTRGATTKIFIHEENF